MKYFASLLLVFTTLIACAQAPTGYYNSVQGKTGYALKTELKNIITNGHNTQSYGDLWNAYYTSDIDNYYENDGTILDIYSENPTGNDPYEYTPGNNDQCGNYNSEGDCYNREHLMPQSWFNENLPMKTDIHHVVPTDGYVNGHRGHLPFGEVNNASYTSNNGSKKGNNVYNYPTTYNGEVFEPIDEFKGDIARAYFYMATRYENEIGSWEGENDGSQNTLNGSSDQVFEDWMLSMLIEWHIDDPVSQKEIDRNNEAYLFQGNRNPYVDHPEWVEDVWESFISVPTNKREQFSIYPNPIINNEVFINTPYQSGFEVQIFALNGKKMMQKNFSKSNNKIRLNNLNSGIYFIKINTQNQSFIQKLIIP
ncbi:endonuclease [Mesonia sp. K7]|uniref:endonuclease n=1 Tax=Mesonia sp. K7 TaxID=2218606 RepID=UPI000DA6F34C|nr:endonuclease [Mesonia sp. K7]PZD77922.1 endonuclease I [Mesonia sp. K7]